MSGRLIERCEQAGIGFFASMVSNGLSLKPDVYLRLQRRRVNSFQITLDGLARTHDLMRPVKAGGGSFDIILQNLVDVTALPEFAANRTSVTIRVNINRRNHDKVVELIDLLADRGLATRNVGLDFRPVVDWGGNQADRDSLAAAEFSTREIDWMLHAIQRGFQFDGILPARTIAPCMVVMPDARSTTLRQHLSLLRIPVHAEVRLAQIQDRPHPEHRPGPQRPGRHTRVVHRHPLRHVALSALPAVSGMRRRLRQAMVQWRNRLPVVQAQSAGTAGAGLLDAQTETPARGSAGSGDCLSSTVKRRATFRIRMRRRLTSRPAAPSGNAASGR